MPVKKEDLEFKVEQLISLFDSLLLVENFPAYRKLKKDYYKLFYRIKQRNKIEDISEIDFDSIKSSIRIMMRAPPKNRILGKLILDHMQEIYNIQNSTLL